MSLTAYQLLLLLMTKFFACMADFHQSWSPSHSYSKLPDPLTSQKTVCFAIYSGLTLSEANLAGVKMIEEFLTLSVSQLSSLS
jgi:hypothetical protein